MLRVAATTGEFWGEEIGRRSDMGFHRLLEKKQDRLLE